MKNLLKKSIKINPKKLKADEDKTNTELSILQKKLETENNFLSQFYDLVCVKDEKNSSLYYFKRKENIIIQTKFNLGEKFITFEIKAYLPLGLTLSQKPIFSTIINELLNPNLRDYEKLVIEDDKIAFIKTVYLKKKFSLVEKKSYLLTLQDTLNASHFYAIIIEREFINYIHILAN